MTKQLGTMDKDYKLIRASGVVRDVYERKAFVVRIVDGDTLDLAVDLGFGSYIRARFRLVGIDTPEVYGVKKGSAEYNAGMDASAYIKRWLEANAEVEVLQPVDPSMKPREQYIVTIRSYKTKKGKYGRWLCSVHAASGAGESLNQALVREGHAVERSY